MAENRSSSTGIEGTQRAREASATQDRSNDKKASIKVALIVTAIILLIGISTSLANANLGIWGWLVIAAILSIAGSRLENPKFTLSRGIKTLGLVILGTVFIVSGPAKYIASKVHDFNAYTTCAADEKCTENKERLEAEIEAAEAKAIADAELEKKLRIAREAALASARNSLMGSEGYSAKLFGLFKPVELRKNEQVGPVNQYNGSCMFAIKSGFGSLQVFSRPDTSSTPVPAIMGRDGVSVDSWGHEGPAHQLFYKALKGSITIELERRRGNDSCK